MAKVRSLFIVSLLLMSLSVFAQSADQEVVSVVDSPDPVTPGATLSYTVTIRNNGPNAATNGGLNINLSNDLTHTTDSVPAGWTCFWSGNSGTCNTPSFAVGTQVLTINAQVGTHLAAFPDRTITSNFFPSGTTPDPNNGNNMKTSDTLVDSAQVDLSVSASDSPDPVGPDGTLTYTINVANDGPDTASTVNFNVVPNSALAFQSVSAPAGWTCMPPSVGALNATFTCSRATWAPGTGIFTVVFKANDENLGINDTALNANFNINSMASNETDNSDNSQTISTQYATPDADVAITVTDSPDPVGRDQNFTYTVNVTNNGPSAAPNAQMSVYNASGLGFVSMTVPAGWSCTPPAVGAFLQFSCTNPSFAVGAASTFTIVANTNPTYFGVTDGTIQTSFTTGSSITDPVNGNNTEVESTGYVTDDADMAITVSDSPDPVGRNANITYTVDVVNNGPAAAPNATMSVYNSSGLAFVSLTAPAGWNCTPPAVGAFLQFSCTNPSLAVGATATFTVVANTDPNYFGTNDGTILTSFSTGSSLSDPVNANNSEVESTAYVTDDADMAVSVTDSPDPVGRDENITYTVTVVNNGPTAAPNAQMSVYNSSGLAFVSLTTPAGWSCTPPAVGAFLQFSCSNPSLAVGANSTFTVVANTDPNYFGIFDGTIQTAFTVGSSLADPVNANNTEVESTAYVMDDANLGVTATDSPDPVAAGSNITYSGTLTNAGPDAATNVTFTVPLSPNLLFQSITGPAGFSCTTPAVGTNGTITCTIASLPNGASVPFTLVTQVNPSVNNGPDGFIEQTFVIGSAVADPTVANNELELTTQYTTPDADIVVTNSDTPDPVSPGGTITYTQTIRNDGPDAAVNTLFTEGLPSSVAFVSLTQSGPAFTCSTPAVGGYGSISCVIASLASGASTTFTVVVDVTANSGTIGNTVTGDSNTYDPDASDNEASVSTTILTPLVADLGISKSTSTSSAAEGGTVVYTITLVNNGPDSASNVVVTDVLPSQILFQSISTPAGFTCSTPAQGANGTVTCTAATFPNGSNVTFTLIGRVATGAVGPINNTATVTSSTDDNTGGNDSGSSAPVGVGGNGSADLSVTKSTQTTTAAPGDTITWTIVATNAGPNTANSVVVTDTLPSSLLFSSITEPSGFDCQTPAVGMTGTITCTGGPLADDATATFTLVTTIAGNASGTISNGATISGSDGDPTGGNNVSTSTPIVVASADLAITKTTTSTSTTTGSNVTYTITVTNNGPDAATNVVVNDNLPTGLTFVSATPSQGTCSGTDPFACNLGTLADGASATITLVATVTSSSGTITNTATVTSPTDDSTPGNNTSSTPPLPVGPEREDVAGIPTLSEWMLLALATMLGAVAMMKMRS